MHFVLEKTSKIIFDEVKVNAFFVDKDGNFCQKYCFDGYNIIADKSGFLDSRRIDDVCCNTIIPRILPQVKKIEF
jgi:hypothetical protein